MSEAACLTPYCVFHAGHEGAHWVDRTYYNLEAARALTRRRALALARGRRMYRVWRRQELMVCLQAFSRMQRIARAYQRTARIWRGRAERAQLEAFAERSVRRTQVHIRTEVGKRNRELADELDKAREQLAYVQENLDCTVGDAIQAFRERDAARARIGQLEAALRDVLIFAEVAGEYQYECMNCFADPLKDSEHVKDCEIANFDPQTWLEQARAALAGPAGAVGEGEG